MFAPFAADFAHNLLVPSLITKGKPNGRLQHRHSLGTHKIGISFHVSIYADTSFDMRPRQRSEMNFFEYLHTSYYYLKQFLKLIPNVKPDSIAFFKGRLDFSRIDLIQRMIMSVALRLSDEIQKGEFLSPRAARAWAEELHARFIT